jgi:hypothetical protein
VARQFLTGTKFGSKKGKVQKPARIPPQTLPVGGKSAEAGQFHSPRKIVYPAESKLVFRIFVKKVRTSVKKHRHFYYLHFDSANLLQYYHVHQTPYFFPPHLPRH